MKAAIIMILLSVFTVTPSYAFTEEELLIGLIPEENIFRQMERHMPLADYLTEKLGVKTRFTILSRYGDIIDRFVSRSMDGAFFGVFTSVLAYEKLNVEFIARPVHLDGSTTVQSFIFVRKDSGIKSASDMKGKNAAFVDRATSTGYIFALAYLRENGISNIDSFFNEYYFTGSHDSAVHAVLDGRADIGVAKSWIFNSIIEKDPLIKDELLIIAKSGNLPDTTLCIRNDLEPALKQLIKDTLLNIHKDSKGRDVLKQLGALRFEPARIEDYSMVMELSRKAGIDIRTYKYR
jgi:phosphonate transport system substrate-binding protein